MTLLPECGALYFISDSNIPTHLWIHNDSMYVRFGGISNTKTWSKSISTVAQVISRRLVLWAEETCTYSWSRFISVNCRPTAS